MHNFLYRVACSANSVPSRRARETFFGALISEINTARKSDQYDVRIDWIDPLRLAQETAARHEAHELSCGDSPLIATDAGSAIAYANGCASIVACYDFFDDVERLARVTGMSPEQLRNRLYAALSHADRLVVVGHEAQQMACSYCSRDYHFVQLPPLSLYRNAANGEGGTPVIVLHDPQNVDDADAARKMFRDRFGVPDVVVADATSDSMENVSEISIAVHLGRDRQSRPGMRLVDFWASGIPMAQYLPGRFVHGCDLGPGAGLVADSEDGLLSASLTELYSHIELLTDDPVLRSVFARNAKAKIVGMRPIWLEIIQHGLFGTEQ